MTLILPLLIDGTAGNDTLVGGSAGDALYGYAGNDSLSGGTGDDTLDGGAGTNRIDAGDGNDTIVIDPLASNTWSGSWFQPANGVDGGAGYDTMVFSGNAADYHIVQIVGGTLQITDLTTGAQTQAIGVEHLQFADTDIFLQPPPAGMLWGTALADALSGTSAAETLLGQAGDDTLSGGGGNDTLDGGSGADRLNGGAGADRIVQDGADVVLSGGTGSDTLALTSAVSVDLSAADQTRGDAASTTGFESVDASLLRQGVALTGSAGANTLLGGQGDDVIRGGKGADALAGAGGADHFVYLSLAESGPATADSIQGFVAGQDVIDLSAIDAIKGGGNDAFTFIGGAAFTAAGQLRYDAVSGLVEADVNGDHVADLEIALDPGLTMQAQDFVL